MTAYYIGSQTSGSLTRISRIRLPGDLETWYTSQGILYPDGREVEGIGIIPDIKVLPTIEGIRSNKDEVLERAIEYLSGIK